MATILTVTMTPTKTVVVLKMDSVTTGGISIGGAGGEIGGVFVGAENEIVLSCTGGLTIGTCGKLGVGSMAVGTAVGSGMSGVAVMAVITRLIK